MGRRLGTTIGFAFVLSAVLFGQDTAYYKAIQKGSSNKLPPEQLRTMEENALKDFSRPESYESLAMSFGDTTEKVWAVIYGEVYCNLSVDPDRSGRIGSLVFRWYEGSLSRQGNSLSVDLTENAQSSPTRVPFESVFEQSFLFGAIGVKGDFPPLSIQKLTEIRRNQLSLWNQKKLPKTELVRRQEAILSAGHFEAYNYWLFKSARAEEFNEWKNGHQAQFQAWLDWQGKNKFEVQTPDFQRLYLLRKGDGGQRQSHSLTRPGMRRDCPSLKPDQTALLIAAGWLSISAEPASRARTRAWRLQYRPMISYNRAS